MRYISTAGFTLFEVLIAWSLLVIVLLSLNLVQVKCLKRLRRVYLNQQKLVKLDNQRQRQHV